MEGLELETGNTAPLQIFVGLRESDPRCCLHFLGSMVYLSMHWKVKCESQVCVAQTAENAMNFFSSGDSFFPEKMAVLNDLIGSRRRT